MEQEKLEEKVRELFEEQGFGLEASRYGFKAEKGNTMLNLKVFSSQEYSGDEVSEKVAEGDKVFVDAGLEGLKNELENDVSVLEGENEVEEYETPSYEVIGDIAVVNDLAGIDREEAVNGILQHQNVKTILLKKGGLEGEFRIGDYEKLYGDETETVHREFSCRYQVDPTKVYFSERFSTERKRVIDQIDEGERVLVMFAGVGPFAILAAKKSDPGEVVAVEKNPEGAEYLKENIRMNGVEDTVKGIGGDVGEIVPEQRMFDRVVMPLPESANEFLGLAMEHTGDNGVIHYYRFVEDDEWESVEAEIRNAADSLGLEFEIIDRVVCGERGPSVSRVCLDVKILR